MSREICLKIQPRHYRNIKGILRSILVIVYITTRFINSQNIILNAESRKNTNLSAFNVYFLIRRIYYSTTTRCEYVPVVVSITNSFNPFLLISI